ncbi:LysR family transcriptional regulator [Tanticharoenia sakaeratensis]|uniref:LysR family transcriptional regulator n=1 Tax=Tanticharoenia sakaeratensis NBRC 103193 TaxID=1231623 RepID=A0A0D6MH68_9PROT|nr:LysR family transcriptional regulator [Tanticharoenia sakaeratensis]GAN52972.1 LysR family transcriptional regulator [Tanticharoenia sakaeratensis NBRC 103193]GBQ19895.1 transcriptional regulator [Tanticharoenia sakaeratensis NBRC 103193]
MADVDLNLLDALDVLLAESSVTAAARRLGLSASAMSRTLARLRDATGDPLLVRAGRGLVPTPRAAELRDRVQTLARDARAILQPQPAHLDVASLTRTFTIRASEAFLDLLAAPVVEAVLRTAHGVRLRFVPKTSKDAAPLRDGSVDLEIGVRGTDAPEIRTRFLFADRLVGVVREGHPLLAGDGPTPYRLATCDHVVASRNDNGLDPIEHALAQLDLGRMVRVVVPGYPDAMRIARGSELVAFVPRSCLGHALPPKHGAPRGLATFEAPFALPEFKIVAIWHPRMDADPAHRWLRDLITGICRKAYPKA